MKNCNKIVLSVITGLVLLTAHLATASVFDDAVAWWRTPTDTNGDHKLGTTELPDALHIGNPSDFRNTISITGAGSNVTVRTEEVFMPYRGVSLGAQPCVHFSVNVLATNSAGKITKGDCSRVVLPKLFAVTNAAEYSAVIRFKAYSMPQPAVNDSTLLQMGYSWSSDFGVCLCLRSDVPGATILDGGDAIWPVIVPGKSTIQKFTGTNEKRTLPSRSYAYRLTTNQWIDVAFTVKNKKLTLYTAPEGGLPLVQTGTAGGTNPTANSQTWSLGGEQGQTVSTATSVKNFDGSIHQVAIWNRCLSSNEVVEAFSYPGMNQWQLGVDNGSAEEFAGDGSPVDLGGDSDFRNVPSSIAAGASLVVNFNTATNEAGLSQVLRVKTTAASGKSRMNVNLNGHAIGTMDVSSGKESSLDVRKGLTVAGPNTLSIANVGTGRVEFDTIQFGGSVQLGVANYSSGEFLQETYADKRFDLVSKATGRLSRAIKHSGVSTNNVLCAVLPKELTETHRIKFVVTAYAQCESKDAPAVNQYVDLYVNGKYKGELLLPGYTEGQIKGKTYGPAVDNEFKFERGELLNGANEFRLSCSPKTLGKPGYTMIDCVRLMTLSNDGFLLLFR